MDETRETGAPDEVAEALRRLEQKVESLHVELEEKKRLLESAEMKQLLDIERLKFTEEVQGDILAWMRRRFWWVVVIVSLVSIFGVRFLIEATANKQVFDQIIGTTTSVVSDLEALKGDAEAAVEAFDKRRAELEARLDKLEPAVAGLSTLPRLEEQVDSQRAFDDEIADWVFWTQIEVAADRAELLAALQERNPDLNWPPSVRSRTELSRLRHDKVIVYVTRRPNRDYQERLKLAEDVRNRFIEYGYFAETWIGGARGPKDGAGLARSLSDDLGKVAEALGIDPADIAQKCLSYCLLVDRGLSNRPDGGADEAAKLVADRGDATDGREKFGAAADEDRLDEVRREILRGVLPNRNPVTVPTEFDLADYIANIRDYSQAFPAKRPVADDRAMVVVLGSLR